MEHEIHLIGCDFYSSSCYNKKYLLNCSQSEGKVFNYKLPLKKIFKPYETLLKEFYWNQIKLHTDGYHNKMEKNYNDNSQEEKHFEKYNCECSNCRNKFGNLGLLADVIEQNANRILEPIPSTSQEESPPRNSNKKEMKCDHCGKIFTHKGDLNKHVRSHTGEQPFICQICDRKFAHTSNLTRHVRLHTGNRPFKCDNCDKAFNRKDKLDLHRRSKSCKSKLPE